MSATFYPPARAEVILQYFSTSWNEIAERMPELAEAGYTALWLPPPFKAGGGTYDVGFGTFDRFDLGDKHQMGTIRTRYGTTDELLNMIKIAHRFGLRVYFDNVMAHNGGPLPGYDEHTPITAQPGFLPEDFHLVTRSDGTYRRAPYADDIDYQNEWQVLYRNPFGLDIALENEGGDNMNRSFGPYEGNFFPKYFGIRHPSNPEFYPDLDLPVATNHQGQVVYTFADKEPYQDIGCATCPAGSAGNLRFDFNDANGNGQHDAGEASEPFADTGIDPSTPDRRVAGWGYGNGRYDMGNPTSEDVNSMLMRAARWFVDKARIDGFRLDAVKHVPFYFFGKTSGSDKDYVNWGYSGAIQEQFNVTHGYSDWSNHRNSCYNDRIPRDDALLYGEHLGSPPYEGNYLDAGMRIANDNVLNGIKGNVGGNLSGMDQPGWASLGVDVSMMYVMSHDNNYLYGGDRPSAHALILTRAGLPIVYTDGYHQSGPPDWFPKPAYLPFLGQFDSKYLPNLLYIHNHFARGDQIPKWGNQDFVAYERRDKRENAGMSDADGTVLLFGMARGYQPIGQNLNVFQTTFPEGARLYNYSFHGGGFYAQVSEGRVNAIVPPGGYFAFSWRSPEESQLWKGFGGKPLTIYENGREAGAVAVERRDGPDGDPAFNPHGLADNVTTDYTYTIHLPRVTVATNLRFVARVDGSAADVRFKLDGGVDLNAQMGIGSTNPPARDAPPGATTDTFLGYEFSRFVNRQYPEKFAAADSARDKIGSAGAETYIKTVGTAGYTRNDSDGVNDWSNTYTPSWVWHDPTNFVNAVGIPTTNRHFQTDAGTTFTLWVKMGSACNANRMFLYYTTDGATWPEGAGGEGAGNTRVLPFQFTASDRSDGSLDWWSATVTNLIGGTPLRYKIGAVRMQGTNYACGVGADIPFPFGESDIARKTAMLGVWEITNFNSATVFHKPHNDHGVSETGLEEGFHALSARAYLQRDGRAAIYNTFPRTFYLDTAAPTGRIVYPAADGETLYGSQYGVRVRADRTVKEVLYRILDSRPDNDDSATGVSQGNGAWVRAIEVSPDQAINSPFPRQWNFDYVNIAPTGTAQIAMRLREISSSTNMALSDAEGHFTTLIRGVETRGPDYRLFVAWPPSDGQVVGAGYVLKAYFTKALADNASAEQMVDWFTLNADGEFQPRSGYSISYNETLDYHALAWTIPNLYNGVPDEQHLIEITLARTNYPILTATRRVRAQPVTIPFLKIVSPPAAGDDGQSYVIRLPDVASPTVTQRQYLVQVESGSEASNVTVFFSQGTGALIPDANNPTNLGNGKLWNFTWQFPVTNEATLIEGLFQLRADLDTNADTNTVEAYALRDTRVVLRETVPVSLTDDDDDDDGLFDIDETTPASLPGTPFTEWDNGDVHRYTIYGRTDFLSPDADGDGLPDGLELGWRNPINSNTVTTTDTDGDGYPNFIGDRDPPFFNTAENYGRVPGVALADQGNKTDLKAGTMTDPNNPDSDFDGLPDGLEDLNRNGWVDGDGADLPLDYEPWLGRNWPDRSRDGGDVWLETDPNNADTDKDGLSDGYGEDKDGDGRIGGDANSNRVYDAGEAWTETDPLETDTDGDTLPDGWESLYALDPLNNGTDSLRTADAADGNPDHGAGGDPDGDGANNLAELISGTDPRAPNSGIPPPPGAIVIGPGSNITVGAVANNNEFTDWKYTDLIALDPPDSLEGPFNGGDVYYRPWASDGLENSRDLVAFYARDGGSVSNGGDGKFYFRVDLHNLQAHAEDSGLDVYVVVDTGNTAIGERKMVDEVDVLTDMRWEAVVALYDGNSGRVYVNTPGSPDTSSLSDTLVISPTDVQMRTRADPDGFKQAHYSAELDAVEFSISRNALTAAGWSGDPSQLRYQVFTTRDGTGNSPRGPGDLDGPDIADSIRTDWIAEDFAGTGRNKDAAYADQLRYESRVALTTLSQWVGVNADNDRGKRVKVISIVHANQALQPGSAMQNLIDNGAGAGYYRPLDAHQAHGVPMTLHMTPTMASAIEWAAVDTNAGPAYRDGPAFNARLRQMMAAGTVQLLGTTFSDHLLPYFTSEFNEDNLALANEFLRAFYGTNAVSAKTFWTPERLLDHDVLAKVAQLGFSYTFCDQMLHLRQWFGFSSAVGVDGYRIHRVNNVNLIPISDLFYQPQFSQTDSGPSLAFREQLNKTARNGAWNGQHPQVMTLMSNWENFGENSKADAYDRNIRWLASRGWIQFITPDQIANNQIDISTPPDAVPDAWNRADHGTVPSLAKVAHDWLHYAAQGNYDNWYVGAWNEEGLESRYFEVRPGTSVGQRYGMLYTGGMVSGAWATVSAMTDSNLARLGRATLHASVLLSGFHDQPAANLTKFSTGQYVYPDASSNRLAFFARSAQAQTRTAALFERVEDWARTVTNGLPPATDVEDADADGEGEYFLYNDRLFAAFERVGGRMIGAWVRDVLDGRVYQAVGNQVGYAGSETEYEGAYNVQSNGTIGAYRTSGLKDWYGTVGGDIYNNMLYTMADLTNGWRMVSANGAITKSVTLAARSSAFEVQYSADGPLANQPLYVRHGLSPNLYQLLLTGQRALGPAVVDGGVVSVSETNYATTVQSFIGYADAANHGVGFNEGAVDDNPGQGPVFGTVNMRNQAQTHQVELVGTNAFAFSLGFRAYPSDWDQDGLPNTYEDQQGFSATNAADGAMDGDEDGVINADEYVAGTAHNDGGDYLSAVETRHQTNGIVVRFRSELNRRYFLSYSDVGLMAPRWAPATPEGLDGNGGTIQWLDDGTRTAPHPFSVSNRTYRVGVRLP
jgi:hypothetical protein